MMMMMMAEATTAEGAPVNSNGSQAVDDDAAAGVTTTLTADSHTTAAAAVERATPLDMYGREQCLVLGRRSFGGFNPVAAANWYAQNQEGQQQAREPKASDAELLRRYKDLAQGRDGNDRKPRSGSSKRAKQGISNNQNKRKIGGLDKMLLE